MLPVGLSMLMDPKTKTTWHVTEEVAGRTVAAALRHWLPDHSWSRVQKLVRSRRIQVNGNPCLDAARRLKVGDVVACTPVPAPPTPREDDIVVRHVDRHVVVVEKPAGITTVRHPEERHWPKRRKQLQPTLDELLPRVLEPRQRRTKKKPPRVIPVHRLDRDTSGLMVFARTEDARVQLTRLFRRHDIHRLYLAIVLGPVDEQTIESNLVRNRGDGRRGSTTLPGVGKRAVTHVRPIERLGEYTLVECRLETGRTHQIRIHLGELGHPVCGDRLYRQPLFRPVIPDPSRAPRLALHAAELGFRHPITGEPMRFRSPLPNDLALFLNRLRLESRGKHPPKGKKKRNRTK